MKRVITYGTFDRFHTGHYNLLKRAKALGDYLIVGVTTDRYDIERGKMNTSQDLLTRIESIKASGLADKIVIEEYIGQKIDDIKRFECDIFAIGSDWEGQFDYLKEYCEVIYLPRTEGISSTQIRNEHNFVKLGIVGTGNIAKRFVTESKFVNGLKIVGAYNPSKDLCIQFCNECSIENTMQSYEKLIEISDAIYIASPPSTHFEYSKQALLANCHVLCETPFVLKKNEAEELYHISEERGLILSVALKTAYCPAFSRLISLLKTGIVGDIVEINASVTTLTNEHSPKLDKKLMGGSMSENACFPLLPIFKLLGVNYKNINFYSLFKNEVDFFTKAVLRFEKGVASFQIGLGVKSEGNLIVSGTKGYAYVPAPWWKTDYFELRFEDANENKKFFYQFDGDGLRYEIKDFVTSIAMGSKNNMFLTKEENIAMARVQQQFVEQLNVFRI